MPHNKVYTLLQVVFFEKIQINFADKMEETSYVYLTRQTNRVFVGNINNKVFVILHC